MTITGGTATTTADRSSAASRAADGNPSRKASGLDPNRLSLLIAVLGRRAGIALGSHDVYANLAGGLSVAEPALDGQGRRRIGELHGLAGARDLHHAVVAAGKLPPTQSSGGLAGVAHEGRRLCDSPR